MEGKRVCQEIVEALVRQNPGCPLARHCEMFRDSCMEIVLPPPKPMKKPKRAKKV